MFYLSGRDQTTATLSSPKFSSSAVVNTCDSPLRNEQVVGRQNHAMEDLDHEVRKPVFKA